MSSFQISIMVLVIAFSHGCRSEVEMSNLANHRPSQSLPTPLSQPTSMENSPTDVEVDPRIVPQIDATPLNHDQRKLLASTLPRRVRIVLENGTLEVLGLSSEEKAGIGWNPDIRVLMETGQQRSELLKAFYFDASAGPNPSACFIPRHGLRATYKGKTVEVIICYQCHLFVVEGDLGEYNGGFYREGSASHRLFEQILQPNRVALNDQSQ